MIEHGRRPEEPQRRPVCLCGAQGLHDDKTTTYYCPVDDTWLEPVCGAPPCEYCDDRPEKKPL